MKDKNGKTIGASTEGYKRLKDCRSNLKRVSGAKCIYLDGLKPGVFAVSLVR